MDEQPNNLGTSFNTVAIVGVGLIGGSFGLALRASGFTGPLLGVSSATAIEAAIKIGAVSQSATLEEAAKSADLIYLAQPVDRILETIATLGRYVRPDCLITDAGSTKAAIVQRASELLPPNTFIGGHPLAGKEARGVEAADASLFAGRPYVLTPVSGVDLAVQALDGIVRRIGARPILMTPEAHDRTVALTSHLPQLLSTTLAKTLSDSTDEYIGEVFGTGLLDMTRLALSSPDLWSSILRTNKPEVTVAIDTFISNLVQVRDSLQSDKLITLFGTGTAFARTIRKV